ncbi:Hypothetical protein I595_923 [Croceitalea dokdonensis DOKDO 023]|uniref:Uncharacterized protein n=1 Tax=Croceitalea dokdonensis DOKDO 023 TaxID=1300341 RepID=A0A0P7B0P6_9FLAO|nr:Hypothetical protein I595_923 [Croceitalea dokdonensis DOKDO 023]
MGALKKEERAKVNFRAQCPWFSCGVDKHSRLGKLAYLWFN